MPQVEPADSEIPWAARMVIARLSRVPWVWDVLLEELDECRARQSHFQLRLDLTGAFGGVVDAIVDLRRRRQKDGPA